MGDTIICPSFPPIALTKLLEVSRLKLQVGSLIITVVVTTQPKESFTTSVYVPAERLFATESVCAFESSHKYV